MKSITSRVVFSLLILFNLIIFIKLKFFIPQLSGRTHLLDFETYIRLIKDIGTGINPYTVNYMQTLGPPTVFIYFLPFSVFNLPTAKFLYTLLNIICGFAICSAIAKKFFRKNTINWFLLLTLLFFSSFPARFSIEIGQPNLVSGYLITLLICRPKTKITNIILSFLITVKANYIVLLISFVQKNLKLVIKSFFTFILIVVFFFPIIKPAFYSYYLLHKNQNILPVITNRDTLNYYNQSIPARLSTLGFGNLTPGLFLILALITFWTVYKSQNLYLGILASIILSPVSWQHYFAVLYPVFIVSFLKTKGFYKAMALISLFFWWVEFPFLHTAKVNLFTAVLSSHYLISAIVLFFIIYKNINNRTHSFKIM